MSSRRVIMPDGTSFRFWDDATSYGRAYHVAQGHPAAADDNDGTERHPFATVGRAAEALQPGEKVIVHEGVYRECVRPPRGGAGPDRMIAYEAAPGEQVHIRGSQLWRAEFRPSVGWRPPIGAWMGDMPAEWFVGYNPFSTANMPERYIAYGRAWTTEETRRFQLRRGAVFARGVPLRQVFRLHELAERDGAFWVEEPGLRIHFRLPGDADPNDPGAPGLEVTAREQCFAPAERGLGYIRVSGFVIEQAANGIPFPQRGALSAERGHHWIIERNTIRHVNTLGVDIGMQKDVEPGRPADEVGGHIVRDNTVGGCGICGIAGLRGIEGSLVEGNLVERIGSLGVEHIYECAGMKFHVARGVLIRRNVVRHVRDACGIWLDCICANCRVSGNVLADIQTLLAGVYVEANPEVNMVDGNFFWDMRDVPTNKPPKDGIPGGIGVSSDVSDHTIAAHNFFGDISGHYAAAMHLAQRGRITAGRVAMCRGMRVLNNVFVGCPRRVYLARVEGNSCDGNLFDERDDRGSLEVQDPARTARFNLAGWREIFGFDLHGRHARIDAQFDPDDLVLTLKIAGEPSTCAEVPEFHGQDEYPGPGPFDAETWRELRSGRTVRIKLPLRH